jgi:ribosomal protein S18 acetylase RimI-like enzyme
MSKEIKLRSAEKKDIPFLAGIVLLAETSGHELISYRQMFPISEEKLLEAFKTILNNNQPGHGLTYTTFLIAEYDGVPAAAACAYIEGVHGSSNHLMTGALMTAFETEEVIGAYRKNGKYKDVQIAKTLGTLQLDSVATLAEYRGKGLLKMIFDEHCRLASLEGCKKLEVQVWAGNEGAVGAYQKLGCCITNEKYINFTDKMVGGRLLMTKELMGSSIN